jgi:hypothetical protein
MPTGPSARSAPVKRIGPLSQEHPHLRFIADTAAERNSAQAGNLLNSLGCHLKVVADLSGARAAYEGVIIAIDENVHGPDHPGVAVSVKNLGAVPAQCDLAGPLAAFERASPFFTRALALITPRRAPFKATSTC